MVNTPFFVKTVGRRKTSVATARIITGGVGKIRVNKLRVEEFFVDSPNIILIVQRPLRIFRSPILDVDINVSGGGRPSKSISIQLALSRSLILIQPNSRKLFRKYRFLTTDSRRKERRKYGLKKSRKSSQFSKR
jgi:small subunit ribosomal protein S9